jgi:hypothetical protein
MAADKQNQESSQFELCILPQATCAASSRQAITTRFLSRGKQTIGTSHERMATMKRNLGIGAAFLAIIAALGFGSRLLEKKASVEAATIQVPTFEVDPMWPKPLPNHWVIGMTIGVSVDAQENVWIIHRGGSLEAKETYGNTNPPGADCCVTAPPVLEFDKEGNLIGHWGGPGKGYNWPNSRAMFGLAGTAAQWIPNCKILGPAQRRKQVNRAPMRTIKS